MSKTACLLVFVLVGAAAFGWKYRQLPPTPPTAPPRATAKVYIHEGKFAVQPAWQEILAQSKSEVRDHLKIEADQCGGMTVVSLSLSDLPRETILPLVNLVASAYAQTCRSQWTVETEHAYTAAQEKVREAQRAVQDADARLESLRQRQSEQATAENGRPEPPPVVLADNPQWSEAARRLADLEEKRRVLLFERTPLHPSVQEIEMRIGEMRREMASIPARIAQPSAVAPPSVQRLPASPPVAPEELDAAQQAASSLHGQLQQAETAARTALTARSGELRVDIEPAEAIPSIAAPQRVTPALLGMVLLTAMTSVIGLGMISFGAALEPVLSSIGELQALLPVPVLGVVPAVHPAQPTQSALRRRLARYAAILSGLFLLIAVGCFFFHA
jgi:hypothetical protein